MLKIRLQKQCAVAGIEKLRTDVECKQLFLCLKYILNS
jgi:hypothetical protein